MLIFKLIVDPRAGDLHRSTASHYLAVSPPTAFTVICVSIFKYRPMFKMCLKIKLFYPSNTWEISQLEFSNHINILLKGSIKRNSKYQEANL